VANWQAWIFQWLAEFAAKSVRHLISVRQLIELLQMCGELNLSQKRGSKTTWSDEHRSEMQQSRKGYSEPEPCGCPAHRVRSESLWRKRRFGRSLGSSSGSAFDAAGRGIRTPYNAGDGIGAKKCP
jgi:hypothetical protein